VGKINPTITPKTKKPPINRELFVDQRLKQLEYNKGAEQRRCKAQHQYYTIDLINDFIVTFLYLLTDLTVKMASPLSM